MHLLFCVHFTNNFSFLRVLNLDIFPSQMRRGVFSVLYIQTLHNDCLYIEDVHLPFCTHFMIFVFICGGLELRPFFLQHRQFSFLNIQTLDNDSSYIGHMYLLFCAHLINILLF